jgi:hypothetical protein
MTVSFVGSASAAATTLTLPTHQAGDLLIIAAASAVNTLITIPSGWNRLHYRADSGLATNRALSVGYKIATTAAETSGTWSNGTVMACVVYRHTTNLITLGGMRFSGASNSTTLTYGPMTASGDTSGIITPNQWVIAIGMVGSNSLAAETAPTGFTNRVAIAGASNTELAMHDSNAEVASVGTLNVALGGSAASMSAVAAIHDLGWAKTSAGMLVHPGMSGGMRG